MKYLSVCSGIEAASVAWHPLGWRAAAYSEIEPFPSAVLAARWPEIPNLGDLTKFQTWPNYAINLLVGGTPCQSFSVAGLRKGLADPRGNLTLTFLAVAAQYRPRWLVWENVPGVLSDKSGAFGAFLGGLAELGYGFAYRILDAQFFGVAQRRRRVFVVGHLGDWRRAAAVLFERESLRGDFAPSRETRQDVAGTLSARTEGGGGLGTDFDLSGGVVHAPANTPGNRSNPRQGDPCHTLHKPADSVVAFTQNQCGDVLTGAVAASIGTNQSATGRNTAKAMIGTAVRRLTPRECERLQGFPDDYTAILYRNKPAADGPRYKVLGNSMAVPVMRWIGERIQMVESL